MRRIAAALLITAATATAHAGTTVPSRTDYTEPRVLYIDNDDSVDCSVLVYVFTKGELAGLPPSSVITGLELDKLHDATTGPNTGGVKIYLANTTDTYANTSVNVGGHTAGATLVYQDDTQQIAETTGWYSLGAFNGAPFTYTGEGLKVILIWDGTALPEAPGLKLFNRSRLDFAGAAAGSTTAYRLLGIPVTDSDTLFPGMRRPNTRFTFTPPASPWIVLQSGFLTIARGASYSNPDAFVAGVATPQPLTVTNAGGADADLSAGAVFSNLVNVGVVASGLPSTLVAGATTDLVLTHTPATTGTTSYTTDVGGASFSQSGSAVSTPYPRAVMWFVEDGRTSDLYYSVPMRERVVGEEHDFSVVLASTGTEAVTITAVIVTDGLTVDLELPFVDPGPIDPGEEVELVGTYTCSEGSTQGSVRIETDGGTRTAVVYCTGVTPIEAPPVLVPELEVEWDTLDQYGIIENGVAVELAEFSDPEPLTLTLRNVGTGPLTITAEDVTVDGCDWTGTTTPTFPLVIGVGDEVVVAGELELTDPYPSIEFAFLSDDEDESLMIAEFTYGITSGDPDIEVSWQTRDAGAVAVPGYTVVLPEAYEGRVDLVIRNRGTDHLRIDEVTGAGVECEWTMSPERQFPLYVEPGGTMTITGDMNGFGPYPELSITVVSDDPDEPEVEVEFSFSGGSGGDDGCLSAAPHTSPVALVGVLLLALRRRRRRPAAA